VSPAYYCGTDAKPPRPVSRQNQDFLCSRATFCARGTYCTKPPQGEMELLILAGMLDLGPVGIEGFAAFEFKTVVDVVALEADVDDFATTVFGFE
jgi:hypothetical protein